MIATSKYLNKPTRTEEEVRASRAPASIRGLYVVNRQWNGTGGDYLSAWDEQHGAAFTSIKKAMAFYTKDAAETAAAEAARRVPKLVTGKPLTYRVIIAS